MPMPRAWTSSGSSCSMSRSASSSGWRKRALSSMVNLASRARRRPSPVTTSGLISSREPSCSMKARYRLPISVTAGCTCAASRPRAYATARPWKGWKPMTGSTEALRMRSGVAAAPLAPAAGMHLGFDHDAAAEAEGRIARLRAGLRHLTAGNGNAVARQYLLGLVLVELHAVSLAVAQGNEIGVAAQDAIVHNDIGVQCHETTLRGHGERIEMDLPAFVLAEGAVEVLKQLLKGGCRLSLQAERAGQLLRLARCWTRGGIDAYLRDRPVPRL